MLSFISKARPCSWRVFRMSHDDLQAYELIGAVRERRRDGIRRDLCTAQMRGW